MKGYVFSMSFLLFMALTATMVSCKRPVVPGEEAQELLLKASDYKQKKEAADELAFWQSKLKSDPQNNVLLQQTGYASIACFAAAGDAKQLEYADSLLKNALDRCGGKEGDLLLTLAQLSIMRHRFPEAYAYAKKAELADCDRHLQNYVLFDAALELNQTDEAKACLDKVGAKESFAYLLRKSKWLDHIGQLDDAIAAMEKAANVAKEKSRESNYVWALANLGDMYGHAGRIQDAYTSFKKVLALQPTQLHALKGIAWIAYSHHGDVALARQIVNAIHEMRPVPDNYLLLAEFCEYEGRKAEAEKWQNEFLSAASAPVYGGMYNKYLIDLYAKSDMQPEKAVALAQRELANRKTPETMTWLAWAHFSSGNTEQVKSILGDPLLQEGGEPGLMAKRAVMLQKTGHKEAAQALLESLRENAFELGPVEMKGLQQIHLNP